MAESRSHNADKTPVFGLDELEPADATGSAPKAESPNPGNREGTAEPHVALHDELSGVRLVTDRFPIEIGNGRNFDMALRGPGPDGLYARIDRIDGGLRIERCHERVFLAVEHMETDGRELAVPGSFQLGEHVIGLRYCDAVIAKAQRKPPKWALAAGIVLFILAATLMRFLLKADEADSRVSVVVPELTEKVVDSAPPEAVVREPEMAQVDTRASAVVDEPAPNDADVAAEQAGASPSTPESDGSEGVEPVAIAPIVLAIEPSVVSAEPESVPIESASDPEPEDRPTERRQSESEPQEPLRQAAPAAAEPARHADDAASPRPLDRYLDGERIPLADVNGALHNAIAAIEMFEVRRTLEGRFRAWEDLAHAEDSLGLEAPSVHQEEIRDTLGEALIASAAELAEQDDERRAYGLYARAAALGDEVPDGRRLMVRLDERAARLYRFGYRLRYSDPVTAARYWDRVIDEVPPQSGWHGKARTALDELQEA